MSDYLTDSKRPFCFECGGQLAYVDKRLVFAERNYHGTTVKMHKDCAKRYDDEKPVTARVVRHE